MRALGRGRRTRCGPSCRRTSQDALDRHEAAGTVDDPEYLAATAVFYERHVCRVVPMPQDFVDSEHQMEAEPTVYHTMNGVNEFFVTGTLRDWTVVDRLDRVAAPTLVVAGEFDEATPETWAPFVERIPDVAQHVFPGASHCSHLEQPEAFRARRRRLPRAHDDDPDATAPLRPPCPDAEQPMSATAENQRTLESFGYKQELKRSVSTVDLLIYGLIFMVPIAPWAIFGTVYNSAAGMVPLVYLIGLVAMIFTALAYAQMAKSFPLAGSVFSYVGRGIHPSLGFFAGWAILLDYLLVPTLLYVFAAESMVGIFPGSAALGVGAGLRRDQHRREPARHQLDQAGQPGVPGHRGRLRRDLHRHRGARRSTAARSPARSGAPTRSGPRRR